MMAKSLGPIIASGNFGRIMRAVGISHPLWARETALEEMPATHYPQKPSRWTSCFACPTQDIARGYRQALSVKDPTVAWQLLYDVQTTNKGAVEHRADFNVVQPLPGLAHDLNAIAHLYWTAGLWVTIKEMPNIRYEEVVTSSSLRILKCLG
jgi:hypothetical protein